MKHIIIPCAGRGSRLGQDKPKALVEVAGSPIIAHFIARIVMSHKENEDLMMHIVAGYKTEDLMKAVAMGAMGNMKLHVNTEWESTGPADSVALVCKTIPDVKMVTVIDGDVIPDLFEVNKFTRAVEPLVGIRRPTLDPDPVCVTVKDGGAILMDRSGSTDWEWACLAKVKTHWFTDEKRQTSSLWETIEPHLPVDCTEVNSVEIDTPEMLAYAETWLKENKRD